MSGKPMDPERLAALRDMASDVAWMPNIGPLDLVELLADRDHWEAAAKRLREHAQRDATSIDAYLAALARTYLAIDPSCPANPDGTGEWDIHDPIRAATELRDRAEEARAEIARLRSRAQVTAEDVERSGVTRNRAEAWLAASPEWHRMDDGSWPESSVWRRDDLAVVEVDSAGEWLAHAITTIARYDTAECWRILDEMAAMPAEGEGK